MQAGIRFASEESSSGEELRAELRLFSRRQAPDTRDAETMGKETGRGILRRRSGSRLSGRRFSSSTSYELGFDENPRRRRVFLTQSRFEWPDSPWLSDSRPAVKRMIMKPPNFDGKGSVMTFLAKFDNCGEYNGWSKQENFQYLTKTLEDPASQVLWDLQSHGVVSYKKLRAVLVQVYGSRGQAEVYRAQVRMVRR